ncbi:MAG TPA: sugar transferase [Clostridia bacterium]|nr:sugar transferase [Clostridia bacterium]
MVKRAFDIIASLIGLIILSPVMIVITAIIVFTSGFPVFFHQVRVGRHGRKFKIIKFRTMVNNAEKIGDKLTISGDGRITHIGRVLRKYKLDELPQLINVLLGDMSLVGPRPEVPEYVRLYDERQLRVLEVRPGITDYASIKFRNENEILAAAAQPEKLYIDRIMPYKLELNLKYIEEMSFLTDLKIIFTTIIAVMKKDDESSTFIP